MPTTRTYTFLVEKPDDSYEVAVEAVSLHDARVMMYQESQRQPDWLAYHLLDIIDHEDEEEDEESEEEPPEMYKCYCGQHHPMASKDWLCPLAKLPDKD